MTALIIATGQEMARSIMVQIMAVKKMSSVKWTFVSKRKHQCRTVNKMDACDQTIMMQIDQSFIRPQFQIGDRKIF